MSHSIRIACWSSIAIAAFASSPLLAQTQTDFKRIVKNGAGPGMVAGDFTGDQLPDVIYADQSEPGNLRLVRNLGLGASSSPVLVLAGEVVSKWLVAGDVDGDNDLDLVFGTRPQPSTTPPPFPPFPPPGSVGPKGRVGVALNDGTGAFTLVRSALPFDDNGTVARVGRANADAFDDLFVLTNAGITVMLGDGTGAFAHFADFAKTDPALLPPTAPGDVLFDQSAGLALGDYDADGDQDVAVVNHGFAIFNPATLFTFVTLDRIAIHDNDGAGNLTPGASIATGPDTTALLARDFDGNGRADLAALVPGDNQGGVDAGRLEVHLSASGGFTTTQYTPDFNPFRLLTGDFDGDGFEDLATIGFSTFWVFNPLSLFTPPPGWQQQLSVLRGDGTGSFNQPPIVSLCRSHRFASAADFDGDGSDDVVATTIAGANQHYVRYLMSGPRQFVRYPGTGEDLTLATGVNAGTPTGGAPFDEKTATLGDVITLEIASPGGAFVGAPAFLIVGEVPLDPIILTVPGYQNLFFFGLFVDALPIAGPSGPGAAGASLVSIPPIPPLFGSTYFLQVAALSSLAANGVYASTDLHTFAIQ